MRQLLLCFLFFVLFTACNRNKDPEPAKEIAGIVGKWKTLEMQYMRGDSIIIQPGDMEDVPNNEFSIRFDGVMLSGGYGSCCPITEFTVNGVLFEIKPVRQVPVNPNCAYVDCMMCPDVAITQVGDQMTIAWCNGMTGKYVRVR